MPTRTILWAGFLGVCAVTSLAGCPSKDPVTPEPDTTSEPTAKPVEKPKPKCEDLAEKCAATAETQAKIASVETTFAPPEGWIYAQLPEMSVAQADGAPGAIALTTFEGKDKEEAKARDAAYDKLLTSLEVTPPQKFKKPVAPKWDKPDDTNKDGKLEVKIWQMEGAKRQDKNGFLIVLMATDPGGKKILGVAFSPEGDEATGGAILKTVASFVPPEAAK